MPRPSTPAGASAERNVFPSEQGPDGHRGRSGTGDAAAMKLEIMHSTHYQYSAPIAESAMEVRLQPMDGAGQRCIHFALEISSGVKARTYIDGYGNHVHYFNLVKPHTRLSITSRSTVETGLEPDADPGEDLVQDFLRFRSPVVEVAGVRE